MSTRRIRRGVVVGLSLVFAVVASLLASPLPAKASSACLIWGFTTSLDLAPGYWSNGRHTYEFRAVDPHGGTFIESGWFVIDPSAPLHRGEVVFRRGLAAPYSIDGQILDHRINPAQDTQFQLRWGTALSRADSAWFRANSSLAWRWDALADWIVSAPDPVVPLCADQNGGMFLRDRSPDYPE